MRPDPIRLRHPFAPHPIWCRPGGSDFAVFEQVMTRRAFAALDDLGDVGWIVDCGANIGVSAAYFLGRFPGSRVVCVEPDPGTFEILGKNLGPFGDRAIALRAAIWSEVTGLVEAEDAYRDNLDWSRQVRECRAGEPATVEAIDVPALCLRFGIGRISLLKMDVEGAEAVVFAADPGPWLARVDALAIEIHDDSRFGPATEAVLGALVASGFAIERSGELTIARRR